MRKDASSACPCPGAPSRKRDRSNIGAAFCAALRDRRIGNARNDPGHYFDTTVDRGTTCLL